MTKAIFPREQSALHVQRDEVLVWFHVRSVGSPCFRLPDHDINVESVL